MRKFLIVTADDFGLHDSVNEAVGQACQHGILTAASLMIAAPAATDAVRRALALPRLRVGLHVVLADGGAVLPHALVPGLTDAQGHMDARMFSRGVRYFLSPSVRRQLAAEIRAQFAAFARTGLTLDHVNVHKHFHLHPTVLALILGIGREYGLAAVRVPDEPAWFAAMQGGYASALSAGLLKPWVALMKSQLRAAGIRHNDRVFGISASGGMDEDALLSALQRLPPGVSEVYLHPATAGASIAASMSTYRHADELAGLLSPRVRAALNEARVASGGFVDAFSTGG